MTYQHTCKSCLDFIVRCAVISSKAFFQFGKQRQTRRRHEGAVYLVIQADDAKPSQLSNPSGTCVSLTAVILQDRLLHVRTISSNS